MTNSESAAAHHREAIGDGWGIAERFAFLHARGVREFSSAVEVDIPQARSVVVLGWHSYNAYTAALDLVARGLFDVAGYLTRVLFDVPGLILATANDEEKARRFLLRRKGLRASAARKWYERHYPETADFFAPEEGLYDAMNKYAHTGSYHAAALLDTTSEGIIPTVGGRVDGLRACRDAAIVLGLEKYILLAMGEQLRGDSGPNWRADFVLAVEAYNEWFKSVRDAVTRRDADIRRRDSELGSL